MPSALLHLLLQFQPGDADEAAAGQAQLRNFLTICPAQAIFGRELEGDPQWWGHVTGSAWIVDPDFGHVVLLHHAKLGRWLQPGGHSEGESDVLAVAHREAWEETGLPVRPLASGIFDVDIHAIPPYRETPGHFHYDARFVFVVPRSAAPVVSDESHAVRWVAIDDVPSLTDEESVMRMVRKTQLRALAMG